mgnify:CR=1 FL=1
MAKDMAQGDRRRARVRPGPWNDSRLRGGPRGGYTRIRGPGGAARADVVDDRGAAGAWQTGRVPADLIMSPLTGDDFIRARAVADDLPVRIVDVDGTERYLNANGAFRVRAQ